MAESYDVAVVGGGPAGIAAAVAAARGGARTALVERSDVLGGNAGCALVHTICGLYLPAAAGRPEFANPGFPRELAELLLARGCAAPAERAGRVYVLPTYPHRMREVLRELVDGTDDLTLHMTTQLVAARVDDAELELRVRGPAPAEVHVPIAIDCTGDAVLAAQVGVRCETASPASLQTPSLIFRVRGVAPEETEGFGRMRVSLSVARAEMKSQLRPGAGSILLRPGPEPSEAYITLNVARTGEHVHPPFDIAELERITERSRCDAEALVAYLREHRPGFRDCEVVEWPRRIGVRETSRIVGIERVEAPDVLNGRRRDDEVAVSTWPIELWNSHKGAHFDYPSAPSSVPLGALISATNHRLGAAGRCLSASHEALGALRVIGTALATGEAVGVAAALAADRGVTLGEIEPASVTSVTRRARSRAVRRLDPSRATIHGQARRDGCR